MSRKIIQPDVYSWLSESLVEYFKTIKNEYLLSLFDALIEYTSYHTNCCQYFSLEKHNNLHLYPQVLYDKDKNLAILKKLFFVSDKAFKIITYDSYTSWEKEEPKEFTFSLRKIKKGSKVDSKNMELNTMILKNNMEPARVRELLLKKSYERRELQRFLVLKNEAGMVNYEKINKSFVKFDLSFLKDSGFLNVKRYSSFLNVLGNDLIVDVLVSTKFEIPEIPEQLKEEQLIDMLTLEE